MKNLIKQMTDIESSNKEQLNEAASLNVSAETGAEIADMISAMQGNAGMGKPVAGDMPMPMRHDIDKFRAAVDDDPNIPGKDDVPGDQDLQAGLLGQIAGAALGGVAGNALGGATGASAALGAKGGALGAKAGFGAADALGKGLAGKVTGGALGHGVGSAIGKALPGAAGAAIGGKIGDKVTGSDDVDEITKDQEKLPPKLVKAIKDKEAKDGKTDEWANSAPGEETSDRGDMGDYEDNIRDGDDLHKRKKAYKATQTGDNPMAVEGLTAESIKATLLKALSEKKKTMVKGPDGKMVPDYAADGKGKNDLSKDKKAKKVSEGEFKKTGKDGDGSFDESGCVGEMKKLKASGCAKHEMYNKVSEKYGCSKGKFEKLYAGHCG